YREVGCATSSFCDEDGEMSTPELASTRLLWRKKRDVASAEPWSGTRAGVQARPLRRRVSERLPPCIGAASFESPCDCSSAGGWQAGGPKLARGVSRDGPGGGLQRMSGAPASL